jgi:SOS response regulatory protein OraA/RecX
MADTCQRELKLSDSGQLKTQTGIQESPMAYALRLLGRRSYSVSNLEEKLCLRYTNVEATEVLSRLLSKHYLDDQQLAKDRALVGRTRKRWGDMRIRRDLMHQGISAKIVVQTIDQLEQLYPQSETLKQTINVWVDRHGEPSKISEIKKIYDHCYRLGFPAEQIRTLLGCFWDGLDS